MLNKSFHSFISVALFIVLLSMACTSLKYGNYMDSSYQIVEIEKHGTKGVIFPDSVDFPLLQFERLNNFRFRFTPIPEDIRKFETLFHDRYDEFITTRDYYNPDISNTAETYQRYVRQYFGYIDYEGQQNLFVIFKKLENDRQRENWYITPSWKTSGDFILISNLDALELYDVSDIGYTPGENSDN